MRSLFATLWLLLGAALLAGVYWGFLMTPESTVWTLMASALLAIAEANAKAIRQVAEAIESPGGIQAVNLKVAEQYVNAFSNIAKTNNTVIVPANLADLAGLITAAMTVFKAQTAPDAPTLTRRT